MSRYSVGLIVLCLVVGTAEARQQSGPSYSIQVKQRADPLRSFPLCPGSRWTYQFANSRVTAVEGEVYHFKGRQIVTVLSQHVTDRGTVVVMSSKLQSVRVTRSGPGQANAEELERRMADFKSGDMFGHYLVQGSYVYEIPDRVWDPGRNEFTKDSTEYFARFDSPRGDGTVPEFFFPMTVGLSWADRWREREAVECLTRWMEGQPTEPDCPGFGSYFWNVESREKVKLPYGTVTAYSLTYTTVGGIVRRWFTDGIGIVRERYRDDRELQLLAFTSGRCRPSKKGRTKRSSRRHELR